MSSFLLLGCLYVLNVSVLVAIRHKESTDSEQYAHSLPFGDLKHEQQIVRKKMLASRMDYTKAAPGRVRGMYGGETDLAKSRIEPPLPREPPKSTAGPTAYMKTGDARAGDETEQADGDFDVY